jgi:hypothetical protein
MKVVATSDVYRNPNKANIHVLSSTRNPTTLIRHSSTKKQGLPPETMRRKSRRFFFLSRRFFFFSRRRFPYFMIVAYTPSSFALSTRLICCSSIFDSKLKPSPSIDQRTGRNQYNQLFPNTFLYTNTIKPWQLAILLSTYFQFLFQPKLYFLTILALAGSLISCISMVVLPFNTNIV